MRTARCHFFTPVWAGVLFFGIQISRAAPQVLDISPRAGAPGTAIIVTGTGFGTNAGAVSAKVGGVSAGVVSVAEEEVRLNAPAATGTVEVTVNGESSTSLLPFTATRTVSGAFVPPAGMNAAGYYTGSPMAPVAGLAFSVPVSQTTVELVWAWRGEESSMFGAPVFPGAATAQIDAASTALAMLVISPAAPRGDPVAVNEYIARVAGSAELAAVVSLIQQAGVSGYNYLDDGRYAEAYEDLLLKALTPPPQGRVRRDVVRPGPGKVKTLVPASGLAPLRLKYTLSDAPDVTLQVKVEPSDTTPTRLHQNVEIWRVDPSWFSDGFAKIDRMGFSDRPTLLNPTPYGTGFVSAKLGSANLDVSEWIAKTVPSLIFGDFFKVEGDAKFSLPRAVPGVYIVNTYSGNYWYGLPNIDPGATQEPLIALMDVNHQWRDAAITNVMIEAVDLVSAVLPDFKVMNSKELAKVIKSVSTKVTKTTTAYIAANGRLDLKGAGQITLAAVGGVFKASVGVLAERLADRAWDGPVKLYFGAMFKTLKEQFSALSKLSSVLQSIERGASLLTPTHYAVERAVVTVGDPFAPTITAFYPPSGRAGDYITITGEFLPFSTTGYEVNFITFAGTGAPPPINARLKATILSANSGVWTVSVPNAVQWEATFGPGNHEVFLGIKNTVTGGESVTSANPAPNYQWRYKAPPVLTGVSPNPARSSGILTVEATGLDPNEDRGISVEIDGSGYGSEYTVTDARVLLRISNLTQGAHTLRLYYQSTSGQVAGSSNTLNFTVSDPFPPIVGNAPRRLDVSLRSMNNVADGQLSLYEAMATAAGTLGRSLTVRPQDQSDGAFESDRVTFPPGVTGSYGDGSGIRDSITIASSATGPQLQPVTAALPPPRDGDSISLSGIIFDGAGAPPGTIGWDLRGVAGHRLDGATEFRNFTGGGIVLGNGSRLNTVAGVTVTHCGGDGVVFTGTATDNFFRWLKVSGSPGVGVRLSGAGVMRNELASSEAIPLSGVPDVMRITGSGSHGLLIEGGASSNVVDLWEARGNGGDGIRITGAGTAGNYLGGAAIPGYRDTADNAGHGCAILDGAKATTVQNLCAGGNGGDGFLIEGPVTSHHHLRSIGTGFDYAAKLQPGFVRRNTGHSVRIVNSAWNAIGTLNRGFFLNSPPCALGGSTGGATVFITGSGSHDNTVDSAGFGYMEPYWVTSNSSIVLPVAPAATHGLHLHGGAHDNVIGHMNKDAAAYFLATPSGSGLLIEGAGTDHNRVLGCVFGLNRTDIALNGQEMRRGVHLLNGPRSNRIGEAGNQLAQAGNIGWQTPYNSFGALSEAAIRLEGLSAIIDGQGRPVDANVVINNRIGFNILVGGTGVPQHPEVGIHLKNSVSGQWIGSLNRTEGNQISRYGFAGIWIENGTILNESERNRIAGNWTNAGIGTSAVGWNTDPFAGPVTAQALLITGGSGQIIGEGFASYNQFNGSRLCAYLEGGSGHWLRGTDMDRGVKGSVFVHNGTGHRIGGPGSWKNRITRSGTAGDNDTAAITLAGGGGHRVENSTIGDFDTVDTIWGSRGHGVLIHESSNNRIGGTAKDEGNLIVRSAVHGILLRGAASAENQIGSNRIGTGTVASPNPGNLGDGIHLTGGAHDNIIGGELVPTGAPAGLAPLPSPNSIHGNTGSGVRVDGAATNGNRILLNSITNNGGKGIAHNAGGNRLQPAPGVVHLEKGRVFGSVNLASTPAGSRIEAFMNVIAPQPEGDIFLNSGTVRADGTFDFDANFLPAGSIITATATHAVTGDTSEFTVGTVLPPETFGFSLAVPLGESTLTKNWPAGAPFSAVVLTARCDSAEVELQTLKVNALGTGGFAAALAGVSLFEDVDRNGVMSAPDRELAPLTAFTAGEAELTLTEAFVSESEERRWVLRLHPNGVPAGTVRLEITNAAAVGEYYWQPLGASGVIATFPLQSALFQPGGGGDPRAAWRTSYGLPADGTGVGADNFDADKDGLVNLLEYALGSSPIDGKDAARPDAARATAPDRITFTYQKLRADVTYAVEAATATTGPWSAIGVDQGGTGPAVTASVPVSGGRRFLRLRVQ